MVGQPISGVVEATFEAGFLLSVKVGNSDNILRGVLFKPGRCDPVSVDNDIAPDVPMIRRNSDLMHRQGSAKGGRKSRFREKLLDCCVLLCLSIITYLRFIHRRGDKEIFDLSIENVSAALGLPMTPRIRFTNLRTEKMGVFESSIALLPENAQEYEAPPVVIKDLLGVDLEEDEFALKPHEEGKEGEKSTEDEEVTMPGTRVLKNKKLKINLYRPFGSRVVLDEKGNSLAPLASVAAATGTEVALDEEKRKDFYKKVGMEMRKADAEDKKVEREKRREKRRKQKIKRKRGAMEDEEEEGNDGSGSSEEETGRNHKRAKNIVFDNEEKEVGKINTDSISIAELEEMALKLIT